MISGVAMQPDPGGRVGWPGKPVQLGGPPHRGVPVEQGACGLTASALVACTATGAGSISYMAVLRHGGMGSAATGARTQSTLRTSLRAYRLGQSANSTRPAPHGSYQPDTTAPADQHQMRKVTIVDIDHTVRISRVRQTCVPFRVPSPEDSRFGFEKRSRV